MKRSLRFGPVFIAAVLVLTGCGGGDSETASTPSPSTEKPTPSATPTPYSTHAAEKGEPALVSVANYEFSNPPAYEVAEFEGMLDEFSDVFTTGSLHVVEDQVKPIGYLELITPAPDVAKAFAADLVAELKAEFSTLTEQKGTVETIVGETVVTGPVDDFGDKNYVWYHEGVMSSFYGDPDEAEAFMIAYLQAHA